MLSLRPVEPEEDSSFLFNLLSERTPSESISHRKMPSYARHEHFVRSRPYDAWYIAQVGEGANCERVGAIYLTKDSEIGVHITKRFRGKGYATKAILVLIGEHRRLKYLANINPKNRKSKALFEKLGFTLIQHTYALLP